MVQSSVGDEETFKYYFILVKSKLNAIQIVYLEGFESAGLKYTNLLSRYECVLPGMFYFEFTIMQFYTGRYYFY